MKYLRLYSKVYNHIHTVVFTFSENAEMIWNVFPADVGNRITELSKVIGQLHAEMKQIHTNMFDYSDNTKADPSGGSSFLGKYILGAKNNFKGFNNNERKTAPFHEPVHHEQPAETVEETVNVQESQTTDTEADRKSNEEQSSEGETDNAVDDMNGTEERGKETGIDDVIEISMEEGAEKNTENTSETVIDIESNSDIESEASGKRQDEVMTEKAEDNREELNTDEPTGGSALNEAETEENGEVEENNGTIEDINEDVVEVVSEGSSSEGIKFDLSQTNLVSFLAKRIEEKLEKKVLKETNFTFSGNQATSPTGSDDSQDTGFGSQEFEPSTSSP